MEETNPPFPHDPPSTKVSSPCKICGELALRKYLGVVVCPSCKTFFKNNAEANQVQIRCHFDGDCDINIHTRHTCRSCRLKKCFANGMQRELLRGSLSTTTKAKAREAKAAASHVSTSMVVATTTQIPTLNLLRSDQSTLTVEQWNLLSNVTHCYDEHSGFSAADRFVRDQNTLPIKSRFKITPVSDLAASLMAGAQLLFEKNADFLSLNTHDRSLLLHRNLRYTGSFGASFIVHSTSLFDNPAFFRTVEIVFGSTSAADAKRAGAQVDSDIVVMKLILAIILFFTSGYTVYTNAAQTDFEDVRAVWRMQDVYTELAWRYLVHKHNHAHAVRCFSNAIRCILTVNGAVVEAMATETYTSLVDSLVKQTEETLSLKD